MGTDALARSGFCSCRHTLADADLCWGSGSHHANKRWSGVAHSPAGRGHHFVGPLADDCPARLQLWGPGRRYGRELAAAAGHPDRRRQSSVVFTIESRERGHLVTAITAGHRTRRIRTRRRSADKPCSGDGHRRTDMAVRRGNGDRERVRVHAV